MITDNEKFIEIQGILSLSDISPNNCIKINNLIIELSKENQELKKQLEISKMANSTNVDLSLKLLTEKENQQKEFVKYLEDEIKFYKNRDTYIVADILGSYDLNDIELKLLEEILSKYKEIIGVSHEQRKNIRFI